MSPKSSLTLFSVLLIAIVSLHTQNVEAANILGLFTSHSPSHLIVHMSVVKALAEKGHNVTIVSTLEPKVTHPSIRHIVIPPAEEQEKAMNEIMTEMAGQKNSIISTIGKFFGSLGLMIDMQFDILKDERFTALYESPDTKFDLVIVGYFMNDFLLGVAGKFKCPVIVDWSGPTMELIGDMVGNPNEIAYVPNINIGVKPNERMGLLKRAQNMFANVLMKAIWFAMDRRLSGYYNELFSSEQNFPTYWDMKKNISLVFCNGHFSEGPIRPYVPALVEIGGIQIKEKPDPLPKDIADFLDSSKKNGAILFSLGSNVKGTNIKPEINQIIFKVLSSLKQNVIWKWEDLEKTPGKAANILYKKWLPQDDILAHPNTKLFITHAGKGGLAESQYHGVPMVALPIFGDQISNAVAMESSGYGLKQDLLQLEESTFKHALTEVLSNPVYATNVKEFSKLYRDRPLTAKETVAFWAEYVIRHHGAAHIQSPLVHMNAIESHNLDVIAFLCLVIYLVWRLFKFAFKKLCARFCKSCKTTKKPSSGKKVKKQ